MTFDRLRHTWEVLGRDDPLWAVLSSRSKYNNQWDSAEFFETGVTEINGLFEDLAAKDVAVRSGRCLDFGCGVGRVSQALCDHFESVDGVDIAQSMVDAARKYNRHGERCRYHVNPKDDLSLFDDSSFDFVYSNIVLQHMETQYAERYIAEFLRVLAPGGVTVFQVPSRFREMSRPTLRTHLSRVQVGAVPTLEVGSRTPVTVSVENVGDEAWPTTLPIQVGNHWLADDGSVLMLDDGRSPLPGEMGPGDQRSVGVWVTAPSAPGRYILEFDLVEEAVTWFVDGGSTTARTTVEVTQPPLSTRLARTLRQRTQRSASAPAEVAPAVMEMHAVPKDRVLAIVAAGGGEAIDVSEFDVAGPEWESYRYVVRKHPESPSMSTDVTGSNA